MRILSAQRPKVESVGNGISRTLEETTYQWEAEGNLYRMTVPKGFLFDGASIPRPFWTILGLAPHGDMDGPALAHDFIYHHKGEMPWGTLHIRWAAGDWRSAKRVLTRSEADALLKELCTYFKVAPRLGSAKAWLVWAAVRTFGWVAWRRDDEARKTESLDQLTGEMT